MKSLDGREIAGYMKNNQMHSVKSLISRKVHPKLVIIRNSENPVIRKYVKLKQKYGEDIGVTVEDWPGKDVSELIEKANQDESVHGVIVQLPLEGEDDVDEILNKISPEKDVDGLVNYQNYASHDILSLKNCRKNGQNDNNKYASDDIITGVVRGDFDKNDYSSGDINSTEKVAVDNEKNASDYASHDISKQQFFESATATAINWLLAGYDIELQGKKIAIVGRGRLVGAPLAKMWQDSGFDVEVFHRGSDLGRLKDFDVLVSATGVPNLITSKMVKPGAVVVDAGTASEDGVLVGDVSNEVRARTDLKAITPKIGGVGPLTVTALFEHALIAAERKVEQ